jgi:SAM-dependent methyltransferase
MSEADRTKWNAKYRERTGSLAAPSAFLLSVTEHLPTWGRALDVAGGRGRHALWLAERGLDVTLVDVSDVAVEAAAAHPGVTTARLDLDADALPDGPWDLVLDFHFLHRPLFAEFPRILAPGGLLVFCQPTKRNLERHGHPSARFLLDDGELPALIRGLEILSYVEDWSEEGRHEARLIARKGLIEPNAKQESIQTHP